MSKYSQEVIDTVWEACEDYCTPGGGGSVGEVIDTVIAIPAVQRLVLEQMGLESRWLCLDNDGFPIGGFLTESGRGLTKVYVEVGPPTEPPA